MEFFTKNELETRQLAQKIGERLKSGDVVLFTGDMGAGKTAFTKGLAEFFEVSDEVTSPTFALVHEYLGRMNIFHFDLYRLSSFDDLYATGFFEYLDRDGVLVVEWSENISELSQELENVVNISVEKLSENERKFTITGKYFD